MSSKRTFLFLIIILSLIYGCGKGFDGEGGNSSITAQALIGSELPISTTNGDQQNPHIIYLRDKNLYFVVYEDWSNANSTGSDIKARFIKADGTFCGNEITITSASGNQTNPWTAYRDRDNTPSYDKILIVWQDTRGTGNNGYVYFRALNTGSLNTTDCSGYSLGTETAIGYNQIKEYSWSTVLTASSNQQIGTGDGTSKDFSAILTNKPVVPGSVQITDGTQVVYDNGHGSLAGAGSGSIFI